MQKRKKKHFFPGSYKLITLKNILVKILEKHIANIILKTAEKYRLLFKIKWEQNVNNPHY